MGPGAGFHYALQTLGNGSLAESLGAASACLAAHRLGGSDDCVELARAQIHWLLGQNPFGVSFLIGMGLVNPQHPHHRLAEAAGFPLVGAIVGGPTSTSELTSDTLPLPSTSDAFAAWSTDALVYEDNANDYVCNEPALDFTAGLVFALGELLDLP
jgi:endoglucanase